MYIIKAICIALICYSTGLSSNGLQTIDEPVLRGSCSGTESVYITCDRPVNKYNLLIKLIGGVPGDQFAVYLSVNGLRRYGQLDSRGNARIKFRFRHPTEGEISTLLDCGFVNFSRFTCR